MQREIRVCEPLDPPIAALTINSALFLSNAIRKDTKVVVNVKEYGVVIIEGWNARRVYPDSESLIGMFRALKRGKRLRGVTLQEKCPEEPPFTKFCGELGGSKLGYLIDPLGCEGLDIYEIDQRVAILNIELDRALKDLDLFTTS
ncbi:hypothetical protein IPA_00035 [Ignicoccus pacificus DSM 13166]|uniref:Uncharacterized protein n=1 Tax=Ignicoccus pacificus DSM 13166 TaxID=940294 RepID=A0A977PKZ1_9CREN|nr:hypothetical protein IPA_00035 [Ignicoccus pacificus DSM 13166]